MKFGSVTHAVFRSVTHVVYARHICSFNPFNLAIRTDIDMNANNKRQVDLVILVGPSVDCLEASRLFIGEKGGPILIQHLYRASL